MSLTRLRNTAYHYVVYAEEYHNIINWIVQVMAEASERLSQAKALEEVVRTQYNSSIQLWGKFQAGVLTDESLQV